jgi:hypothetical protein
MTIVVLIPKDFEFKCGEEFITHLKRRLIGKSVKIGQEIPFIILGQQYVFIVKETLPESEVVIDDNTIIKIDCNQSTVGISFTYGTKCLFIKQGENEISIEYKKLTVDDVKVLIRNFTDIIGILINHL